MIDANSAAAKLLQIITRMHALERPYVIPTKAALRQVFEQVFWSSLNQYEGKALKARIFFAPRAALTRSGGIISFETRHALSEESIRRFSPAHSSDGGLLVVEDPVTGVGIEGILGSSPFVQGGFPLWLCVEARGPGVVRVRTGHWPLFEFARGSVKQLGGMSFDRTFAELLLMGAALFPADLLSYQRSPQRYHPF